MDVRFTVTGSTYDEIESSAIAIINGFVADRKAPDRVGIAALTQPAEGVVYDLAFDVRPIAEKWGEEVPDMWEAEVQASTT